MKFRSLIFSSMVVTFLVSYAIVHAEVTVSASFKVNAFENFSELNDYGQWVSVPGFGAVWRPDAGTDWRPFQYGHWVYSNEGWVWDSDEPFGWIVCHYGNWFYDDDQGWVWLPGNTWSPARVKWYVTDNEIGWEPLFPEHRPGHHWDKIHMQWNFCPVQFFTEVEVRNHVSFHARPKAGDVSIHVYNSPPRREFVQRIVQRPIVSISLNKTRISANDHPLFKVEIGEHQHSRDEVPIGPRFRRGGERNRPEPQGEFHATPQKSFHVTHEEAAQPPLHKERSEQGVVEQPRPSHSEGKFHVEEQSKRDDDNNQDRKKDDENNGQERHKFRENEH
jgi:hypothetical protein